MQNILEVSINIRVSKAVELLYKSKQYSVHLDRHTGLPITITTFDRVD